MRARAVVHQLLEDGPEEINPREFIDQFAQETQPEVFMQHLSRDFVHFFRELERTGVLQLLTKKYDDEAIAEAVMRLALERSPIAQSRRAFLELKRLAHFQV